MAEIPSISARKREPLTIDAAKALLAPFLANNPASDVVLSNDSKHPAIAKPWGDESLALLIPGDYQALVDALNQLYLPERFTAMWHRDTHDLEFIWTALPTAETLKEVVGRSFVFSFNEVAYSCEFGDSSSRLTALAVNTIPLLNSPTQYRNLQSFNYAEAVRAGRATAAATPAPRPLSFWIRNIEWNENHVLSLAVHLNFYMTYFDAKSPAIIIHSPRSETQAVEARTRYTSNEFPTHVEGKRLDDNLLHFWNASRSGDPARRFLYYYRIIEYLSFAYLEVSARNTVKKIMAAPDALHDIKGVTERVLTAIQASKLDEYQKYEALLRETVEPHLLWREINLNLNAFTIETAFDGGFVLPPLITSSTQESDFLNSGVQRVCSHLRLIRNALSHGRDQRTTGVIAPTTANFGRLQPWVSLASVAAGEVILYHSVM